MQEPPGKLVTKENIGMCRMTSEITHLWASDKAIFRTGIPVHFWGKDKKNNNFHHNLVVFPKATVLENKTIWILAEKDAVCLEQICHR